ncbi:ABC transporter permease [Oscillibacter sp. 1-3]|uniref:ABC transporter permease n=1 Tax=Oscillibacter sp. 1-3 TaxID=1235797 RepID=UPI003528472E
MDAPRASIMAQFLVEAAVLCGVGGTIGIGLGVLGALIAGKQLLKMLLFPNTGLAVGAFLFSVLLGIGPGMYPAAKASGLMPVEALRLE